MFTCTRWFFPNNLFCRISAIFLFQLHGGDGEKSRINVCHGKNTLRPSRCIYLAMIENLATVVASQHLEVNRHILFD